MTADWEARLEALQPGIVAAIKPAVRETAARTAAPVTPVLQYVFDLVAAGDPAATIRAKLRPGGEWDQRVRLRLLTG